jgi:hypothetical protein
VFGCQVGKGDRGDVTILPTLVINQRQYRGWCDFGPSSCLPGVAMTKCKHEMGMKADKESF